MKEWYVIHVRTGKEEAVRSWLLKNSNITEDGVLVPKTLKYEWVKGKKNLVSTLLFKGYVLALLDLQDGDYGDYYSIRGNPYVFRLLGSGGVFHPADRQEMDILLKLMGGGSTIGLTKAYCADGKVYFTEGPLRGMEHLVRKVNKRKERAYIGLNIENRPSLLTVGLDIDDRNDG